ncbi:hypothetical protein [Candidatus Uabimicrobium amorphum]|uniref:hypothetical protein n=1 Tax=Uabimicrobium amorphum TaxID=2596890 RepID=UPI00125F982B|nr:hypothetical protein [Candidatus Uabimicrobium amorphum]
MSYSKQIQDWMDRMSLVPCNDCGTPVETTADSVGDDYEFYCPKHISENKYTEEVWIVRE